jgi:hypothetical protein
MDIQFTLHDVCDQNHEGGWRLKLKPETAVHPQRIRPCDLHKLINPLNLRKACRIDGILSEILRHLSRRPLVQLTHLFNNCLWLSHFPKPWKRAKVITLPEPSKDPKFPQNLRSISFLSTTGKLFKEVILKIVQKYFQERGLLNASKFGFHAGHSTILQCMRLTDHVTLNFNNQMFLVIEKVFDTTWHSGLLYKLSKLEFSISFIMLIRSFLSQCKFSISVEGEMPESHEMQSGMPQGSFLSPTLYNIT